jgi:trehalose 6-phosphate phosphatase
VGGQHHYDAFPSANAETSFIGAAMNNSHPIHVSPRQLDIWNTISRRVHTAPEIALFLDYDGTITPIRRTPDEALLAPETVLLLQQLVQLPDLRITIVTGRTMEDIRRLIPLENIGFIANHGFHILQDGKEWKHPDAVRFEQKLQKLHTILKKALEPFPQAYVEDKQFTLSIHYRNVSNREKNSLKALSTETVRAYNPILLITEGKEVLEVRPPVDWGKGHAVMEILKVPQHSARSLQMYIGDDVTDEDAFHSLRSSGITLRVGKVLETYAEYYVTNVNEVLQLLKMIMTLRSHRSKHHFTPEKNKKQE